MNAEIHPVILDFLRNNHLFVNLSETQLSQLANIVREVSFAENEYIIHENEVSDEIYFIKEGEVEVSKFEPVSGQFMPLTVLGNGAVVGEITLLDQAPRSASVRAIKPVILYVLSINELRALTSDNTANLNPAAEKTSVALPLYSLIIQNLAKNLSHRMRMTNDAFVEGLRRELEHTKARAAMGMLIISVVSLISLYLLVLQILNSFKFKLLSSTTVSVPLIAIFAGALFWMMKRGGYPLSLYGFSLKNWRRNLLESILFTLPLCAIVGVYKLVMMQISPRFIGRPFIELNAGVHDPQASIWVGVTVIVMYFLFVPLQEFVTRGALQSSFQELIMGPRKVFWAILLSNLLFSVTHFHVSLGAGLEVYIPGLFWGWMYARQRSLLGVCVSHLMFGGWALFILGIF